MRLTDGKRIVDIQIRRWIEGSGYGPDFSHDFFGSDEVEYDAKKEAWVVEDLDYCINLAHAEACVKYDAELDLYIPDESIHIIVQEQLRVRRI